MSLLRRSLSLVALLVAVQACSPKSEQPSTDKAGNEAPKTDTKADAAAPAAPTGPIATVNGIEIARAEFEAKYAKMTKAFTAQNKEIPETLAQRYKESILRQIIDKELLNQKIKAEGVQIDEADLARELDDYKKMFRTDENFQRYLSSSGVTLEQITENIRHNLGVTKLLEKQGNLQVTDEEIKAFYDENQKRYEVKEQIRASHILVKVETKGDKAAEEAAKKKADEAYKEATKKDADFAEVAKKYSQGPTASRGGDLNFFTRGRMVPEFDEVAFKLKPNEISKPVLTQFGWHVIKVTDRKEGRQRPFDEVKESIAKLLKNKKSRKAKTELLKTLRAAAKIESKEIPAAALVEEVRKPEGAELARPMPAVPADPAGGAAPPPPPAGDAPVPAPTPTPVPAPAPANP